MIGSNYLVDSNIVIEVFKGNKKFARKLVKLEKLLLPVVVLGELYTGINRVSNRPKHMKMLDEFLKLCTIVNIDAETAKIYGGLVADLFKKGKPIPTNDIWICALAKQFNCSVITNDSHFKEVDSISIEMWK